MNSSLPFVDITYRADINQLIVRWLREISQEELQQGYAEALNAALESECSKWLVDSRRRTQSDDEMVTWLESMFLPNTVLRLNQPVRVACLIAATWSGPAPEGTPLAVLASRSETPDGRFHVRLFNDEGTASHWLNSHA